MKINYYRPSGRFFCSSFEIEAIAPDGKKTIIVYGHKMKSFKQVREDFEKNYKKHGWAGIELRRSKAYPY